MKLEMKKIGETKRGGFDWSLTGKIKFLCVFLEEKTKKHVLKKINFSGLQRCHKALPIQ